ncbi:MAG: hypothetical protein JWQ84_2824 [Mucilaginibacter sp.]|jgi:hypothetical protein|nr:hypothetical protein [Mucilaginibacter sp.]MDB5140865.1 hypothetical protein [Mucilaginibacter sp.]
MRGNYQNDQLEMKMAPDTASNVSRPYKILHYTMEYSKTRVSIFNLSHQHKDNKGLDK